LPFLLDTHFSCNTLRVPPFPCLQLGSVGTPDGWELFDSQLHLPSLRPDTHTVCSANSDKTCRIGKTSSGKRPIRECGPLYFHLCDLHHCHSLKICFFDTVHSSKERCATYRHSPLILQYCFDAFLMRQH
jgi:hypothetical protein